MKRFTLKRTGFLFAVLLLCSVKIYAQSVKVVTEERYIALSLYNFTRLINWPPHMASKSDFSIAVLGDKKVYNELVSITTNRTAGAQNFSIIYFDKIEEFSGENHIVYVPSWLSGKFSKLSESETCKNTLMVTEHEDMIKYGSSINFIPRDGELKFELSENNTNKQGLTLNPKLKGMAVLVN